MRAPSLRRRVTLLSVAAMTVLVVVLAAATALTLNYRLRQDLQQRLRDRAELAASIAPTTDLALIADGLTDDEIIAVARRGDDREMGRRVEAGWPDGRGGPGMGGPGMPGTPGGPDDRDPNGPDVDDDGHREPHGSDVRADMNPDAGDIRATVSLGGGTFVTLIASEQSNHRVIARLLGVEALVSLLVVAATGLAVRWFAGRALRPLDEIGAVAGEIAAGDRTLRIRPDRTDTDLGGLATSVDVMVDSLDEAATRAERSEATMRQFLADASHELRNPTAAIGATAERLIHGQNDREQREALALDVVRESRRLGRLVNDLLDLSRLDAGRSTETPSPIDLADLVRDEITRHPATDGAVVALTVADLAPAEPHLALAAGRRTEIGRVIANLIDNAQRHAPPDSRIDVTLAWAPGWTVLAVTNDGPPIPADDREIIFERFSRLDDARDRREGGSGLGLAISRAIARGHGGDLRCVEPAAGRGATFELWLPIPGDEQNPTVPPD